MPTNRLLKGTADAADRLAVYFDFNQNGGNVIDRSGNKNNGQRLNFGPDGDAWVVTKGVFSLNFQANGQSARSSKLTSATTALPTRTTRTRRLARSASADS